MCQQLEKKQTAEAVAAADSDDDMADFFDFLYTYAVDFVCCQLGELAEKKNRAGRERTPFFFIIIQKNIKCRCIL